MRAAALLGLLLLTGAAPAASLPVVMRSGEHPGFGRMVLDLPPGIAANAVQDGDRLTIRFAPPAAVASGAAVPRNVRSMALTPGAIELLLAQGAQLRRMHLDGRLVIDVLDPPPGLTGKPEPGKPESAAASRARLARPKPVEAARVRAPAGRAAPARFVPSVPIDRHDEPTPAPAPAASGPPAVAAPTSPAAAPAGPVRLAAAPSPLPPGVNGRAMSLPFDATVGAAAFRRFGTAVVVFDQRKPIDMAALRGDPAFAAASVELLPAGTVLRLKLPPQNGLRLLRTVAGWTVATVPNDANPGPTRPILPELADGALRLPADLAGQVVAVPDPDTGLLLLVGTQRAPGQNIAATRRTPEFTLLATWLGVAMQPVSDSVSLHATAPGFRVEAATGQALALTAPTATAIAEADAGDFSRRFDFPALSTEALRQRLLAAIDTAATTPVQARTATRLAVAQDMLALGMGVEAQSVLKLAATDDGRATNDPSLLGLSGAAALIAGRPAEAAGLSDPRLTGSDEIALWRGLRAAMEHEGAPGAAQVIAANLPLLLIYPAALRDRLLPLAAETMALGGEGAAARTLLEQRKNDSGLDLARGLLAQAAGDSKTALGIYDRLTDIDDRLVRARAADRAAELRLADGALTPAQAADALDRLMYAWRGDGRELALREREADLRRQAGQYRQALALLRDTAQVFPDSLATLHASMAATFADAVAQDAKTPLPPLELVALAGENADLIPDGEAGQALAARLADRLIALDLPERAIPVLEKLAEQAPAGPVRAQFGDKLAAMRLAEGDAPGALTALTRSSVASLPPPLLESRTLTFARAAAAAGDLPSATAALAALATPPALALRADLLEAAKDWPAAEAALREVVATSVPADGLLVESQQRLLLRFASAAAQAGDDATLADLRDHATARFPDGKLADMFRLLTASPVRNIADLPRAARETKLARALPGDLNTLTP